MSGPPHSSPTLPDLIGSPLPFLLCSDFACHTPGPPENHESTPRWGSPILPALLPQGVTPSADRLPACSPSQTGVEASDAILPLFPLTLPSCSVYLLLGVSYGFLLCPGICPTVHLENLHLKNTKLNCPELRWNYFTITMKLLEIIIDSFPLSYTAGL